MGNEYVSEVTRILEEMARNKKPPVFYSDLSVKIAVAAQSMGGVLEPISKESYDKKKVLLSVLVVRKDSGLPGDEFFEQARRWGAMKEDELPQRFFRQELERVYKAYAAPTS